MAQLVLETSEGVRLRFELAGAGSRGAAALLDLVLFVALELVLLLGLGLLAGVDPVGVGGFLLGLALGGTVLVFVLYHALFLSLWDGRTPGKRAMGLRVVDEEGLPATPLQHLLRSLLLPIEAFVTFPISIGLSLMAVSARRQRLGDLVAGTVVVRERPSSDAFDGALEPFPRLRWSELQEHQLQLSPASAGRIRPAERRHLRALLTRLDLPASVRDHLVLRTARVLLPRLDVTPPGPGEAERALRLLRELYLYLRDASAGRPV